MEEIKELQDTQDSASTYEKLKTALEQERKELSIELKKLFADLKKNDRLTDIQVESLSWHQHCLEMASQYKTRKDKLEISLDKKITEGWKKLSTSSPYKLTSSEKTSMAKADNEQDRLIISLLDIQIDFFRETMANLKNLNYAIKNKLEILQLELV